MKRNLLFLIPAVLLFSSCSFVNRKITYQINNNSDTDLILDFDGDKLSIKAHDKTEYISSNSYSDFVVEKADLPVIQKRVFPRIYFENDPRRYYLTVINHTSDDISYSITNNYNKTDFLIRAKETEKIELYVSSPVLETAHKNYSFSDDKSYLNFN